MSHEKFDQVKAELIDQGLSSEAAALLAAMQTGESDGSVDLNPEQDTANWSEEDWYQNNLRLGMSKAEARFVAQVESGTIDIDDQEVDY